MTIYEQIQRAIDYIEENLSNQISCKDVADETNMSVRSFYNYFWTITGFSYKQYVIKRRLSKALHLIHKENLKIVDVAFESGYETHESFSRAFKNEFGITPVDFRNRPQMLNEVRKLTIIKEMYMGIIVKKLPTMKVVTFEGYAPDPEEKAKYKRDAWLTKSNLKSVPYRIFGYNIDSNGNMAHDPENIGYKFLVTIPEDLDVNVGDEKTEVIKEGKFLVTGIEGNFEADPMGKWITDGWQKLQEMINLKGYRIKSERWFEEELEPSKPGNLRLDLYVEIE